MYLILLFSVFTFCLFPGLPAQRTALADPAIVKAYHTPGYEVYSPRLSPDNSYVTFTRLRHLPKGHAAEYFSDAEWDEIDAKIRANPRYADPEIMLLDLAGTEAKRLDYGWEPSFSADGKKIIYTHQLKPLSGRYALAATLEGNEIRLYDRDLQSVDTVARPAFGSLAAPSFDENGQPLFLLADATNGDWAGAVGLARPDPVTGQIREIYAPRKAHDLYYLVRSFVRHKGKTLVLLKRPLTSGIHLADAYAHELVEAESGALAYTWGERNLWETGQSDVRICPSGPEVYDNERWTPLSAAVPSSMSPAQRRKKAEQDFEERGPQPLRAASPDCSAEALYDKNEVRLHFADGRPDRLWQWAGEEKIQSLSWSPDASLLLLVLAQEGFSKKKPMFDEMLVLRVSSLPLAGQKD